MEPITLVDWDEPTPSSEEWRDEAGRYAIVLRYGDRQAGRQVNVITWDRYGMVPLSPRGGICAASVRDAMGAAIVAAVSIVRELVDDWAAIRGAATAEAGAAEEGWSPTTLSVDGSAVQGRSRAVLDLAWAVVAELPDCFLAAAGSNAVAPSRLQFVTGTVA